MAFVMALTPTYKTEVTVEPPKDGGFDRSTFTAEFLRVDTDELAQCAEMSARELMRKVLVGWAGLLDADKSEVPFSEQSREALLLIPQAMKGLEEAFWKSVFKAKEKN